MDIKGAEKHENGTVTYTYNETPIMSTYLLAFCVGEYDYLEDKTKSGTIVRVYTSKGTVILITSGHKSRIYAFLQSFFLLLSISSRLIFLSRYTHERKWGCFARGLFERFDCCGQFLFQIRIFNFGIFCQIKPGYRNSQFMRKINSNAVGILKFQWCKLIFQNLLVTWRVS